MTTGDLRKADGYAFTLTGMKCALRAFRWNDAERLQEIANDFQVARWMSANFRYPYTIEDARTWIALVSPKSPPNHFAIEIDNVVAGAIGIDPHKNDQSGVAEFGYWLGRQYWGCGIATEAGQLLIQYALDKRNLRRLEAHIFAPNSASSRVLEKCGFALEGILKKRLTDRTGNIRDQLLYALLP